MNARTGAALVALSFLMPASLHAQRGGGPRMGGSGNPVAPLIDMRRELNLSGRQLAQLDSIERNLLQRNEGVRRQLRSRLDSLRPRTRRSSEEEIAAYRAEADSMRSLRQVIARNDSVARSAAMTVLTDSQRVRVRERIAERRGFEAGRRSTARGQRGMRGGRPGTMGPRMRGPGGRIGMDGRGLRQGGMRAPDGVGPRFDDRRRPLPDERFGPMGRAFRGRGGAPVAGDSLSERRRPMDNAGVRPRLRRPPPDSGQ
jgi:Spy/CpxP family protein refolding chaperone